MMEKKKINCGKNKKNKRLESKKGSHKNEAEVKNDRRQFSKGAQKDNF